METITEKQNVVKEGSERLYETKGKEICCEKLAPRNNRKTYLDNMASCTRSEQDILSGREKSYLASHIDKEPQSTNESWESEKKFSQGLGPLTSYPE